MINDTGYLLLELPPLTIPSVHDMVMLISTLKMKRITPIIVHPERNRVFILTMSPYNIFKDLHYLP
jgi:tyrosine-protein phosphatase YwqE